MRSEFKKITATLVCALLVTNIAACAVGTGAGSDSDSTGGISDDSSYEPDSSRGEVSSESVSESQSESESAQESGSESQSESGSESGGSQDIADNIPPTLDSLLPYVNPLTGLATEKNLIGNRPVAIMINNIREAMPQIGISSADIIYECTAEGGVTRLMMVVQDYEGLSVVGSVRSAREYFLDFAQNHDAIYVHAGGSTVPWADAYAEIKNRGINNLDGVNMYLPYTFYRDADRLLTMSPEHCLMTSGSGIAAGIAQLAYRTAISDKLDSFLKFGSTSNQTSGGTAALHVHIPVTSYQTVDYLYDEATSRYYRYQFDGQKHIDGATNEQLSFDNLLVVFCSMHRFENDDYNRMYVETLGEGSGYYIADGKCINITWKKSSHESPIVYYDEAGNVLTLKAGKTMVNVCDSNTKSYVSMNYNW